MVSIWREQAGNQPVFTMLTTAPGPDVEPIHNRQIAVLHRKTGRGGCDGRSPRVRCASRRCGSASNNAHAGRVMRG